MDCIQHLIVKHQSKPINIYGSSFLFVDFLFRSKHLSVVGFVDDSNHFGPLNGFDEVEL